MLRLLGRIILSSTLLISADFPALTQSQNSIRPLTIEKVVVIGDRINKKVIPVQTLINKESKRLCVYLIADGVRRFPRVQIKNYGNIDGLNTINIQSIGSQHAEIFYGDIPAHITFTTKKIATY